MEPLKVHSNDALPTVRFQIADLSNDKFPVNLSEPTTVVTAKFRLKNTETVLQTIILTKIRGNGESGWVEMVWPLTALVIDAGSYEIEISVNFNGRVQTMNRYHWCNEPLDDGDIFPIKVKDDF